MFLLKQMATRALMKQTKVSHVFSLSSVVVSFAEELFMKASAHLYNTLHRSTSLIVVGSEVKRCAQMVEVAVGCFFYLFP